MSAFVREGEQREELEGERVIRAGNGCVEEYGQRTRGSAEGESEEEAIWTESGR